MSKPVISLLEAKHEGVVGSVLFDVKMTRLLALIVHSDSATDATRKRLDIKNIYKQDMDAIVIKTAASMRYAPEPADNPVGLPAYNHEGTFLGMVDDVCVEKSRVLWISSDGVELPACKVLSRSDGLIIFCGPGKPPKLSAQKIKPTTAAAAKLAPLLASPVLDNTRVHLHAQVSRTPPPPNSKPKNYDFLIGKTSERDLFLSSGAPLVMRGDIITDKVIAAARFDHKLVQLALHCR